MGRVGWIASVGALFGVILAGLIALDGRGSPATTAVRDPRDLAGMVDHAAPDFRVETLDGDTLRLGDLHGKVVFLNFWATWCVPCRDEMSAFAEFSYAYGTQEAVIVAVNAGGESREAVEVFLASLGVDGLTVGIDARAQVKALYGVMQLPTTFVIDKRGRVRTIKLGEVTFEDLVGYVDFLRRNP